MNKQNELEGIFNGIIQDKLKLEYHVHHNMIDKAKKDKASLNVGIDMMIEGLCELECDSVSIL